MKSWETSRKGATMNDFGTAGDMGSVFDFGFQGNFDSVFNDLFSDFFGNQRPRQRKGGDLRYNLTIEFEEAVFGGEKEIEIPREEKCPVCNGSRVEPGHEPVICRHCGGRGQVRQSHGFFTINRTCEYCGGEGQVIKHPCKNCKGRGTVRTKKTLKVRIPPGVDNNTRLKVRGEGMQQPGDTIPGDLFVVLQVKEHAVFERAGDDIVVQVDVGFPLLCLGGEITIPTIEGESVLKIPAGTQQGKVFRLKGLGVNKSNGYGGGDQLVYLNIVIPSGLTGSTEDPGRGTGRRVHGLIPADTRVSRKNSWILLGIKRQRQVMGYRSWVRLLTVCSSHNP